jgi:hypothetical protein
VFVRIVNPNDQAVPIYWWTNIALREEADTQVLVPTDAAYLYTYGDGLPRTGYPLRGSSDLSFPANHRWTSDLFFDIPADARPWIATLDAAGRGFLHTSTEPLHGRKLFAWGRGDGGRNWQRFLAGEGEAYFEIQAGLTTTQLEHVPLAAFGSFAWTEALAPLEVEAAATWQARVEATQAFIESELPVERLAETSETLVQLADDSPSRILDRGSGWGALERIERESSGASPWASSGIPFLDDTLGSDQEPWLELIQ